jgi:hypothetical protein
LLWEITSERPPFLDLRDISNYFLYVSYRIGNEKLREDPIKGTPLEYQQLYRKCWDDDPKLRPDIDQVYEISNQLKLQFNTNEQNKHSELQTGY